MLLLKWPFCIFCTKQFKRKVCVFQTYSMLCLDKRRSLVCCNISSTLLPPPSWCCHTTTTNTPRAVKSHPVPPRSETASQAGLA